VSHVVVLNVFFPSFKGDLLISFLLFPSVGREVFFATSSLLSVMLLEEVVPSVEVLTKVVSPIDSFVVLDFSVYVFWPLPVFQSNSFRGFSD